MTSFDYKQVAANRNMSQGPLGLPIIQAPVSQKNIVTGKAGGGEIIA